MNSSVTRRVFFVALLLLIPLPFYHSIVVLLPAARIFLIASAEIYLWLSDASIAMALGDSVSLSLQLLLWVGLLWLLASGYTRWAKDWPASVRGSVMGLLVFSLLIIFSSVPVYYPLGCSTAGVSFLSVYD